MIPTDPDLIQDQTDLVLVLIYNPANPDVVGPIRKHWPILDQARGLTPLHNLNTIVAYRRPPNLKGKLVRAKIQKVTQRNLPQISGRVSNPCMNTIKKPCQICPKLNITGRVTSTVTKRSYTVPAEGTCGHNNLVYLITCKKCSKQYVGETGITINRRFYYHLYNIKNLKHPESAPPSTIDKSYGPMTKHFANIDHS